MRPLRPHCRYPARTVLPLDGSRGVESPGIESIGTHRSVASRSETGHRNSPPIATNALGGAWKISLPHQKVNAGTLPRPRVAQVCEILTLPDRRSSGGWGDDGEARWRSTVAHGDASSRRIKPRPIASLAASATEVDALVCRHSAVDSQCAVPPQLPDLCEELRLSLDTEHRRRRGRAAGHDQIAHFE
ncbi:MAG: hypothetical protein RL591_779 [Planctomycetota bacterium]